MRARGRCGILLIVHSTGGKEMYETMKKESLTQPQRRNAGTPVNRRPPRKPLATGRGDADRQIDEMERTFSDRWEW
jgi:hypothetical protein